MYWRTGENMNNKAIYRKPNGQYFLARSDAATRNAYAEMGYKITDKTGGVAIVMTPKIETEADVLEEYLKHFQLIAVDDSPGEVERSTMPSLATKLVELMQERESWTGTASDLVAVLGEGKINKLFQHGIMDYLNRSGIQVVKKRNSRQRLIEITNTNTTEGG